MVEGCIRARLVALQEEGPRVVYVFKNLDNGEYIMCTRCPNWTGERPVLCQDGYLTYRKVKAGETYYHTHYENEQRYMYSGIYFSNFVPTTHVLKDGFVTEADKLILS